MAESRGIDIKRSADGALILECHATDKGDPSSELVSGSMTLRLYREVPTTGALQNYDFADDTFKDATPTTATVAPTHRTVGTGGAVNTGIWTYRLATLTGFTSGEQYIAKFEHASMAPQCRKFQYGGVEGDTALESSVQAIGPGTGPNIVHLTVRDGDSGELVPGASIRVYTDEEGTDLAAYAVANASAVATVRLENETTYYGLPKAPGYTATMQEFTVDESPEGIAIVMTAIAAPDAPDNPDALIVYVDILGLDAESLGVGEGAFEVTTFTAPDLIDANSIVPPTLPSGTTDANGRAQLTLIRTSQVTVKVSAGKQSWQYTGTVPSAGALEAGSVGLATLIADHGWKRT